MTFLKIFPGWKVGVANGAKTGNPLFDDNDAHSIVYQGTDENHVSIIWQNGAKVE